MKLLLFCALLVESACQGYAQDTVFEQNFSASTIVSDYVDAVNPGITKFTEIAITAGSNGTPTIGIVNGAIELARLNADNAGGQCRLVRSVDLASNANSLYVEFKVDITVGNPVLWSPGNNVAFLNIGTGNGYGSGGSTPTNAETFGKLFFSTQGTAQSVSWTLAKRVNSTSTNSATFFQGPHDITWILNNTGYRVTYVKPAGATAPSTTTIATGTWDVWVDGTPIFTAVPATTAGVDLRKFKFIFDGAIGIMRLDNFLMRDISGALPVSITNFRAAVNGPQVDLNWQAENVPDRSLFAVERSSDGREYTAIQQVNLDPNRTYYGHTDREPLAGTSYYRLRQQNPDGTTAVTRPVAVNVIPNAPGLTILDNPGAGLAIRFRADNLTGANYQLTALTGQLLPCHTSETPNGPVTLQPQHPLPSGVYLLTATAGSVRLTRRVLVQ